MVRLLAVLVLAGASVNAQTFTNGDWEYTVSAGEATITRYSTKIGSAVVPSSLGGFPVTSIGNSAFFSRVLVTSVTIPSGVTSIGNNAFDYCTGLTNVTIPNTVTNIGNSAFAGCNSLTGVSIPDSVRSIGEYAFSGSALGSISLPASITNLGSNAFRNNRGLTNAVLPSGLISLPMQAFSDCISLGTLVIPASVTTIGNSAFGNCTGLTNITIPSSVTSIGDGAFGNCSQLLNLNIPDSVTSIGSGAFSGLNTQAKVNIPRHLEVSYTNYGLTASQAQFLRTKSELNTLETNNYNSGYTNGRLVGRADVTNSPATYSLYTATQYNSQFNTGQLSILINPNIYNLYTTNQIMDLKFGGMVLSASNNQLALTYQIQQSSDLSSWSSYREETIVISNPPSNKMFLRINPKQ